MPEGVEQGRRTSQKGLLVASFRGLKKVSDRAIGPVAEAVCVLGYLALPGSPQSKQLRHLHAQSSLG